MDNVIIDINTTINAPVITVEEIVYNVQITSDSTNVSAEIDASVTQINSTIDASVETRDVTIDVQRSGITGATGAQGIQGIQGEVGDQGIQGFQGVQGIQGIKGDDGIQGLQGIQGNIGIQGDTGTQGVQGAQGAQGDQGIQGEQGIEGEQGDQGIQGNTGETGASGINFRGLWDEDIDYENLDAVSYEGSSWFASGNPPVGDVPETDSDYWFALAVRGETGAQGATGSQGIQGVQGLQGIKGDDGIQGIQGIEGSQGAQGVQGDDGIQGTQGAQGSQGIQGDQGVDGTDGTNLTRGAYQTKSADYQVLSTDDAVSITTSGNTITLQTSGMQNSQEVTIFNDSSGDNTIVGSIDGTTPTTIEANDAFGLMWNGSSYSLMFKKKDESVVGGRTATYLEEFFTESSININNYFESKLANASDFFKQDLKLQHDGFAEDGLVGFVVNPNYDEEFFGVESKTNIELINLGDSENAEVEQANGNSNFAGQTEIAVTDQNAVGNGRTFGLFQWDLTGLSDYTATSVASFNFNISSNGGGVLSRSIIFTVSTQATSFFDENTVTYNNQPSNGTVITTQTTSIPPNSTNLDISVPLTQSEINSCIGEFVFIQVIRVNDITDGSVVLTSKEGTTFPRLSFNAEINY
jgi:hypothetical protein